MSILLWNTFNLFCNIAYETLGECGSWTLWCGKGVRTDGGTHDSQGMNQRTVISNVGTCGRLSPFSNPGEKNSV